MTLAFRLLVAVAAAGLWSAVAAPPSGASEDGPVFGAWKIQCAGEGNCQAFVNLVNAETSQLALTASFHLVAGADRPTGVATIPLGVALKPGVQIRTAASAEAIQLTPEVCYPDGCRIVFTPTPEQLAAIVKGDSYTVNFFAYGAPDRRHSVSVPTDGLKTALDYLAAQQPPRP